MTPSRATCSRRENFNRVCSNPLLLFEVRLFLLWTENRALHYYCFLRCNYYFIILIFLFLYYYHYIPMNKIMEYDIRSTGQLDSTNSNTGRSSWKIGNPLFEVVQVRQEGGFDLSSPCSPLTRKVKARWAGRIRSRKMDVTEVGFRFQNVHFISLPHHIALYCIERSLTSKDSLTISLLSYAACNCSWTHLLVFFFYGIRRKKRRKWRRLMTFLRKKRKKTKKWR